MLRYVPARLLARFGAACTLWRTTQSAAPNAWTQGTTANVFYPCRASHRPPRVYVIKGTMQEQARLFLVDPASLEVIPQIGDRIAIGTHTAPGSGVRWHQITQGPEVSDVAGAAAMYRLQVSE